jgi:sigma-E factor negative regulatory protein RseC
VILSSVVSAGLGVLLARRLARRLEGHSAYKPSLIRVLGSPITGESIINAASKDSD